MASRPNVLQLLRNRANGIGRLLLPTFAVVLLCPLSVVCAATSSAPHAADGGSSAGHAGHPGHADQKAPAHGHGTSSGDAGDNCPHCTTAQASVVSAARADCEIASQGAPPTNLHFDQHLNALLAGIPAAPAIPHPSPPRTAYSTGAGPPAIPLNLLHCVLLI